MDSHPFYPGPSDVQFDVCTSAGVGLALVNLVIVSGCERHNQPQSGGDRNRLGGQGGLGGGSLFQ